MEGDPNQIYTVQIRYTREDTEVKRNQYQSYECFSLTTKASEGGIGRTCLTITKHLPLVEKLLPVECKF